jgi:putative membrane protein
MNHWLLTLHITANLVWIGSIACVGWLVGAAAKAADRSAAVLARGLYLRVAMPAFLVSFLCGSLGLAMAPATYMHLHWFHAKLTCALAVIALHHVLGAKAKRLAAAAAETSSESMQGGRSGGILTGALLASAFLTVVFVIFKETVVP